MFCVKFFIIVFVILSILGAFLLLRFLTISLTSCQETSFSFCFLFALMSVCKLFSIVPSNVICYLYCVGSPENSSSRMPAKASAVFCGVKTLTLCFIRGVSGVQGNALSSITVRLHPCLLVLFPTVSFCKF